MKQNDFESSVSYLIAILAKEHRNYTNSQLSKVGLHTGQEMVLHHLAGGVLSQKELANRMGVKPATVTKVLRRMEAGGYVRRDRDGEDSRVVRVGLTDLGQEGLAAMYSVWEQLDQEVVRGLEQDDILRVKHFLARIVSNIQSVD